MRIGLLSDVHGNLAGLRAVADALARAGPLDEVIVAGDHLWGGPRPGEVWEALGASGWTLLRGNEDERLVAERPDHVPTEDWSGFRTALTSFHGWTRAALGSAVLRALADLPLERRLATPAGDLLVVHATPRSPHEHTAVPDTPAAVAEDVYGGTGASAVAFGHYHHAFVRPLSFALLLDVASVGLPRDGLPLAAYTILTARADGWTVEQRRVLYDAGEECRAADAVGLPRWGPDPL
jgi:predicted phosphodiesterase